MVVLSAVCVCRRLNKATPMIATYRLCLLTHDVSSSVAMIGVREHGHA